MPRLLLVEADPVLQSTLQRLFAAEGYFCSVALDSQTALSALHGQPFDLVILDLGQLPSEALALLREIRLAHHTPVLALAPQGGVVDTVAGLDVGADDYLCEPFDPRELLARARAQLRRGDDYSRPSGDENVNLGEISLGEITVDPEQRDAFRDGVPLHLTAREFELLHLFARYRGRALASGWLVGSIWGSVVGSSKKALQVYVGRLRRKIEVDPLQPELLLSIRGFGYQLAAASTADPDPAS